LPDVDMSELVLELAPELMLPELLPPEPTDLSLVSLLVPLVAPGPLLPPALLLAAPLLGPDPLEPLAPLEPPLPCAKAVAAIRAPVTVSASALVQIFIEVLLQECES
jgi:hypothetical protein